MNETKMRPVVFGYLEAAFDSMCFSSTCTKKVCRGGEKGSPSPSVFGARVRANTGLAQPKTKGMAN